MTWSSAGRGADARLWPWLTRGLWALLVFTAARNAWLCDDAYIYLRAVEQWWAGHGPVWNAGWRVQVFTSPLWYGLLVLARGLLRDGYLAALALSGLFLLLTWQRWATVLGTPQRRALLLALWLVANGVMDYTTSGLETPLAFWVLAGFFGLYVQAAAAPLDTWPRLNAWAGLVALTRLDLLALLGPAWLVRAGQVGRISRRAVARGLWPWLLPAAWYGFALAYYGSPLPNPVYAKLFHGLPRAVVWAQGARYWLGQMLLDPVLVVGLFVAALGLARVRGPERAVAWGVGLYAAYLTAVGGDFMAGRFPALAYSVAVGVALARIPSAWLQAARGRWALAALAAYALLFPHTPVNSPWDHFVSLDFYERWGVGDERGRYFRYTSLLTYLAWRTRPDPPPFFPPYAWSQMGYEFRFSDEPIAVVDSVGMFGYWAGTDKMVLDVWALTDPFLARLPDADGQLWRPGHYERALPPGYLASLREGGNRLTDPDLARLYDLMIWATRAPLTDPARWAHLPAWWWAHAPRPENRSP